MKLMFLDFETYYDNEFSLRRMTPAEYIMDPRFEVMGLAVKEGLDGDPYWVDGPDVGAFFKSIEPSDVCTVTFNALFDQSIMAWRYNFVPKLMIDMLGVARASLGTLLKRLSLGDVGEFLGFGGKLDGGGPLAKAKGLRLDALKANPDLHKQYVSYALRDDDLTAKIYQKLVIDNKFPKKEIVLADAVIRACVLPKFVMDKEILQQAIEEEKMLKQEKLALAMMVGGVNTKTELMSNQKFADALRRFGVEAPRKISPITDNWTYAFSKTDHEFMELLSHEDDGVRILVEARLANKTSIAETRAQALLYIANLDWESIGFSPSSMPIPLRYAGAHTHRLSGDWKINWQNAPKKDRNGEAGALRRALMAPEGHKVLVTDAAQIEARIVAYLAGEQELLKVFEEGGDPYAEFAQEVFGYPVNKKDNPDERFIGKTGILGLGYNCGVRKFQSMVRSQSRQYLGKEINLAMGVAERTVGTYRAKYRNIKALWKTVNSMIPSMAGREASMTLGPVTFKLLRSLEMSLGVVELPNRLNLIYPGLTQSGEQWHYYNKNAMTKLYGGALLENITQALARIIIMDAAMRIYQRTGYWFALQVHDELGYVVPDHMVELTSQVMAEEMVRRPLWAPTLPLAVDPIGVGQSYGEAK